MPVQPCFFNHQVMTRSFKITTPGFDKHYDIYDHPGKYMESMKAGNRKKVIRRRGGGLCTIYVHKRVSAPPCTFMIEMRPFPGLSTQESKAAENREKHPFDYCLLIVCLTRTYCHHHRH